MTAAAADHAIGGFFGKAFIFRPVFIQGNSVSYLGWSDFIHSRRVQVLVDLGKGKINHQMDNTKYFISSPSFLWSRGCPSGVNASQIAWLK